MEDFGGTNRFDCIGSTVKKKRSQTLRRPRPDSQSNVETHDRSPGSSTPLSDDGIKVSSDENSGLECGHRDYSCAGVEGERPRKRDKKDGGLDLFHNNEPGQNGFSNKRSSEGVLAPANWKSTSISKDAFEFESRNADLYNEQNGNSLGSTHPGILLEGFGNENKLKKVKLKVGGVTRTIQTSSNSNGVTASVGPSTKTSHSSEASKSGQKNNFKGHADDIHFSLDKKSGLQGIPWKDFSRGGFTLGKDSLMAKVSGKNTSGKEGDKCELARKSKRATKRRVLLGDFDDDEDDEIRYLVKLKTSKAAAGYRKADEESSKKHKKLSAVSNVDDDIASRSVRDDKKNSRSDRVSGDTDFVKEGSISDGELDGRKKKKQIKETDDSMMDGKREMTLTTRQRALQSSKDASAAGTSVIEFPNGLPPAPPRKQKEKLSEVEQQLKKSEAAQRRRMQVEKAARETEAEAIRKIRGQDSSRKKREMKMKKRLEDLAQEKAANALMLASSTIRLIMGPSGNVVTFPKEMGLPSIFDSKPCSYPPPRESCAGPSCTNPYKYRDSKSKLPLCSLQCYKAVNEKMQAETTC